MSQDHREIPIHQHDGNLSLNIEGLVAKVHQREYHYPGGETQKILFESTNWEEADEFYVEQLCIRDCAKLVRNEN